MKKLIIILIIGAMTSSCGGDSIDISKLDSPCACAEAGVKIMKKIQHLVVVLILSFSFQSCTQSECEKNSSNSDDQEFEIINEMMDYADEQIDKDILYGKASKTIQLDGEEDLKVVHVSWSADSKDRSSERKFQVFMHKLSQEEIENNLSRSDSLK